MSVLRDFRLRARFTLAGLLLAVAGLSIVLAVQANRVARQRRAIAAITQAGGWFLYDYAKDGRLDPLGPPWLRRIAGDDWFDGVARVYLSDTGADDETLRAVADLPSLRRLFLRNTKVTDTGLAYLAGLKRLEALDLRETVISDAGLCTVETMPQLAELSIADTNVAENGMPRLAHLPRLRFLGVSRTSVTPESVAWFPQYRGQGEIRGGNNG